MASTNRRTGFLIACAAGWLAAVPAGHAFDLQGHRGARGLMPENTLEGFAAALSIGVTTLELDLALTKDGVVVVSHDSHLNPDHTRGPDGAFLNGKGPAIRSLTLAELKRYDVGRLKPGTAYGASLPEQRAVDGATIPTLAEVFDLVRRARADHIRFNIETKITPESGAEVADPETFAAAVVRDVRTAGMAARVSVQSFDWRTLAAIKPDRARDRTAPASPSNGNGATTCSAAGAAPRPGRPASTSTTSKARPRGWSKPRDAPSGRRCFRTFRPWNSPRRSRSGSRSCPGP